MIPHEKEMVEKLKNQPFALIGINSDEDREFSKSLAEEERAIFERVGRPTDAELAQLTPAEQAVVRKVRENDRQLCLQVMKDTGVNWRQAVDGSTGGPWARAWNVQGWPTIYVLDVEGRIRYRDLRDQQLEDAVVHLLEEARSAKK